MSVKTRKRDRDTIDEKVLAPLDPVKLFRLFQSHGWEAVYERHAMRSPGVLSHVITAGRRMVEGSALVRSRRSPEELAAIVGAVFRAGNLVDGARSLNITPQQARQACLAAGVRDYPRLSRSESGRMRADKFRAARGRTIIEGRRP